MNDIANARIIEFTLTRSHGQPVNTHVVQRRKAPEPDFESMRKMVHDGHPAVKEVAA